MIKERKKIFDYSHGWTNRGSIWDKVSFGKKSVRTLYDYFHKTKKCPYCYHSINKVLTIYRPLDEFGEENRTIKIWGCFNCGWWCEVRINFELHGWSHKIKSIGILREFDCSDPQLPITSLKMELIKHPGVLYNIHSKKFEQLVADVISDFYETEVTIIGRTNDGGIDLIYLDGDIPTAIQVKRRQRSDKVETVSLIREFLGALILEGFKQGKIVTTANRFSKGSYGATDKALQGGLVEQFDLIDVNRFYELFRFHQKENYHFPWQESVEFWINEFKDLPDTEIEVWKS